MPTALAVSPGRQVRPRINESLKGIVRQWWMVKRFTLPPPLYKKVPEGPAKVLDAESASPDDLGNALLQAGVVGVYRSILRRWFPHVERNLAIFPSGEPCKYDHAGGLLLKI